MTENFKLECKSPAYQNRLGKIEYGDNQIISSSDYLTKIVIDDSCVTNGTIVGSIYAKSITFDTLNIYELTNEEINAKIGVKYADSSTEYINIGKYTIQTETNQKTAKNGQYQGLNDLRLLDNKYICGITDFTNITIKDFLVDLCNQLNLTLGTASFTNDDLPVSGNPFTNNETCRTVLSAILKCSLNFAIINVDNNSLVIRWLDDGVSETFTKDNYDNLTKNEIYQPINSLIIRDPVISGENVVRQDEESIATIGENQFIIEDTYFLYTEELRDKAIDNIWNKVKGLTYVDCQLTTSLGKPYLQVGQKISIEDEDGSYFETYILKHNFTYDGSFYSVIESPVLTKEEEQRKNNTDLKTRFRNTERQVDKINGQIIDIVEEQTETTEKLNKTITTVDETKQTISSVETTVKDITTTTQTSTGGNSLYITDSLESNALEYHIEGKSEQETRNYSNLFDGQLEQGTINSSGVSGSATTRLRTVNYIDVEPNTTYIVNTNVSNIQLGVREFDSSNNFVQPQPTGGSWQTTLPYTFTTSSTTTKIKIIFAYIDASTILPSELTDLEIYLPVMPSPDYPSEIKTIPSIRNLFDGNIKIGNISTTTGIDLTSLLDGRYVTTDYIKIKNSIAIQYKNASTTSYQIVVYEYDIDKNFVQFQHQTLNKCVFALSDTTKYIRLRLMGIIGNTIADYTDIMIEEDMIVHPYVPYGAWTKVRVTGKNLFEISSPLKSITLTGVDITIADDGLITLNGTATANSWPDLIHGIENNTVKHNKIFKTVPTTKQITLSMNIVSGITDGACYSNVGFNNDDASGDYTALSVSNNKPVTVSTTKEIYGINRAWIVITEGQVYDNFSFYLQIEEGIEATECEAYQEKEVLIDLSKPNLFDRNKETVGYYLNSNTGELVSSELTSVSDYIGVEVGNTYTIDFNYTESFAKRVCFYDENKNFILNKEEVNSTNSIYRFTVPSNAVYIRFQYRTVIPDIKLFEGYTDHHELSSINDTKDTLDIVDGQVVIDKKIDKIVLDGSEGWKLESVSGCFYSDTNILSNMLLPTDHETIPQMFCTHLKPDTYRNTWTNKINNTIAVHRDGTSNPRMRNNTYTTIDGLIAWLKGEYDNSTPVTMYYELAEPQQIILPNTNIPLFDGVNHITLVDDLETTTSIKFLRQTPLSNDYATNQQLGITNSNLANTTDKTNQNASDINTTNTNLNNNYYTIPQIDAMNTTTESHITQIKNSVEVLTTSTEHQINVIQETITNGVPKVDALGVSVDINGMHMEKEGEEMSSTMSWDGFEVVRNKGGYNETKVLTVNSSGVETENLTVRTYFTIGDNTRVENYKDGTGFFYIGGAN